MDGLHLPNHLLDLMVTCEVNDSASSVSLLLARLHFPNTINAFLQPFTSTAATAYILTTQLGNVDHDHQDGQLGGGTDHDLQAGMREEDYEAEHLKQVFPHTVMSEADSMQGAGCRAARGQVKLSLLMGPSSRGRLSLLRVSAELEFW